MIYLDVVLRGVSVGIPTHNHDDRYMLDAEVAQAIADAVDDYAPLNAGIVSQNTTYQVQASDNGKIIECNGTFTVTLPNSLPTGFQVTIVNVGSGTITIAASTTMQSKSGNNKLTSQYSGASAYHRGSNVWLVMGDLSA